MADRTCGACGKVFLKPWHFRRHAEGRQTACVAAKVPGRAESHCCKHCNKQFSSASNRARHEKRNCHLAAAARAKEGPPPAAATLEGLQGQVAELQAQMKALIAGGGAIAPVASGPSQGGSTISAGQIANGPITNNEVNATVNATVNVTVYQMGDLRLDEIRAAIVAGLSTDELLEVLHEVQARKSPQPGIDTMVELSRRITTQPGRLDYFAPNKKEGKVGVVRGKDWALEPASMALAPVAQIPIDLVFGRGSEINDPKQGRTEADIAAHSLATDHLAPLDRAIHGYGKTEEIRKADAVMREELLGPRGPFFSLAVENTGRIKQRGGKLPDPGSPAILELREVKPPVVSTSSAAGDA